MEEASSIPGANTMDNNSSRQYESILAQTECCTCRKKRNAFLSPSFVEKAAWEKRAQEKAEEM